MGGDSKGLLYRSNRSTTDKFKTLSNCISFRPASAISITSRFSHRFFWAPSIFIQQLVITPWPLTPDDTLVRNTLHFLSLRRANPTLQSRQFNTGLVFYLLIAFFFGFFFSGHAPREIRTRPVFVMEVEKFSSMDGESFLYLKKKIVISMISSSCRNKNAFVSTLHALRKG